MGTHIHVHKCESCGEEEVVRVPHYVEDQAVRAIFANACMPKRFKHLVHRLNLIWRGRVQNCLLNLILG